MNKEKNIIFIGVDYSLLSPAICVLKNGHYQWVSYPVLNKSKKDQVLQKEISELQDVNYQLQEHFISEGAYEDSDLSKIQKYDLQAGTMLQLLQFVLGPLSLDSSQLQIAFEGYSFGSRFAKTDNIMELAAATTLFKKCLLGNLITETDVYKIFSPKTIKKIAGNVNMKKRELFDVFINSKDSNLEKSFFWEYCKGLTVGKKVPSPIDDMIDAYFVVQTLLVKV